MRVLVFTVITTFSVEMESLGPLLGQIVVALSPFVGVYHQQVSSIFELLILKNRCVTLIYTCISLVM